MSRPKSSWAEIFGAIGATVAAEGAQRAASELKTLRSQQQNSLVVQQETLTLLQEHLENERRMREAEQRLKEFVRSLKQSLFDFNEALPNVKRDIESLLPDFFLGAALFYECQLQQHADKFFSNREMFESYEDKKLVSNVREAVCCISSSIEELASSHRQTLDDVVGILQVRRAEVQNLSKAARDSHEAINGLRGCLAEWNGEGPSDFLDALERLGRATTVVKATATPLFDHFADCIKFVGGHPRIGEIWLETVDVSPESLESLSSTARISLGKAETLLTVWGAQKENFLLLKSLFEKTEYQEFEAKMSSCSTEIQHLPEVGGWTIKAKSLSGEIRNLIDFCKEKMRHRDWKGMAFYLKRTREIPCGGTLQQEIRELDVARQEALWPRRRVWVIAICSLLFVAFYWMGILKWFLCGIALALVVFLLLMVPDIRKERRLGSTWGQILYALPRSKIVW